MLLRLPGTLLAVWCFVYRISGRLHVHLNITIAFARASFEMLECSLASCQSLPVFILWTLITIDPHATQRLSFSRHSPVVFYGYNLKTVYSVHIAGV